MHTTNNHVISQHLFPAVKHGKSCYDSDENKGQT